MNFLAHLHLAFLANSSLSGNLVADFIRGKQSSQFDTAIRTGIAMHRRIDSVTDNLPEVAVARCWFRRETRRVSPIALDVMWDHFLSLHWTMFSPDLPLRDFTSMAERDIAPHLPKLPPEFSRLNYVMWSECWLERYQDMTFIAQVLRAIASKRPKLHALRDTPDDLEKHYDALSQLFKDFYPRMMDLAQQGALSPPERDE